MPPAVNTPPLRPRRARALARQLEEWYAREQRELPWRGVDDPYRSWVSEVMLQQTRVEAVAGRYERFLARFPDLASLAAATQAEVLAEWAGLGYYRRARQLHAAAQQLVAAGEGGLPRHSSALLLLPGFGRYTAGAVASIAFGERVPAVDGNVERVLARLLALDADPKKGEAARTVRAAAQELVDAATAPGDLNQALMELGALRCTPRSPSCGECPWRRGCAAADTGHPAAFPRRPPRRAVEVVSSYVAVQRRGDELLWRRRPEGGRNAGLWELPSCAWRGGEPAEGHAAPALAELADELGARWEVGPALATVRHPITHHRVHFVAHAVEGTVAARRDDLCWASPHAAGGLGITAASAKLLRRLPTLL